MFSPFSAITFLLGQGKEETSLVKNGTFFSSEPPAVFPQLGEVLQSEVRAAEDLELVFCDNDATGSLISCELGEFL